MNLDTLTDALRRLDFQLFAFGGASFTVLTVSKLALLLLVVLWASSRIRHWMVDRGLSHTHFDYGTRVAIGGIVRYVVLVVGFVVVLQNAGINLTAFSVVAGALGVGIGFGLQNIFSNFISGLIIMLERPIKVGDRVELASLEGTIREIGARRTTVLTHDNVVILVPNQKFITDNVVSLDYGGGPIRLRIPLMVSPKSDPAVVESLLLEAARAHPDVLKEPSPAVLLAALGGNARAYELAVWHHPLGPTRQQLGSDLNRAIALSLRANDITTNS
ncbi:mechanosensitive ion channel [soil metagenome]